MGGEGAGGKEGVERGQVRRRGRSGEGAGGREGVEEGQKERKGWRKDRRRNMCLDCTVLLLSWVFAVFHSQ